MRNLMSASALTGLFALSSGSALAQSSPQAAPPDEKNYSLSYGTRDGCHKLAPKDCDGSSKRLELSAGKWTFGLESFNEKAGYTMLDEHGALRYRQHLVADAGLVAKWGINTKGYRFIFDRAFEPLDNVQVKLGGYIGHIEGSAKADVLAYANLYPQRIRSGPQTFYGYTIPGFDVTTPGYHAEYTKEWNKEAKSWFGGLQAAAGWGIPISEHTTLGLSGYGQAGFERIRYGGGAEFIVTSNEDTKIGSYPGGSCQPNAGSGHLKTSARWAISLAACFDKVHKDAGEDAKIRFANRQADKVNKYIGQGQGYLDQANPYINRYGYSMPQMNTVSYAQSYRFFGIDPDYRQVTQSLVASAAFRVTDSATITLSHRHPIKSKYERPVTDITLRVDF